MIKKLNEEAGPSGVNVEPRPSAPESSPGVGLVRRFSSILGCDDSDLTIQTHTPQTWTIARKVLHLSFSHKGKDKDLAECPESIVLHWANKFLCHPS